MPKTYTREDVVEINCHGGIQAVKKVLELAVKYGSHIAEPGEFTKRAFLNGRIDLVQAEAALDAIRAKTEGSLKVAMDQLEGGLSGKIDGIRNKIITLTSHIDAAIDFPEEEIEIMRDAQMKKKAALILKELKDLIATYEQGAVLREGVLIIICGKPNVGKSSLMNLLLKRDRVIVSPSPGTTRDAVEEMINLRGIPARIVDTAGITRTEDIVEKEGVRRSKKYLRLADLAILMLDASTRIDGNDLDMIELVGDKKKIIVINKCDLAKKSEIEKIRQRFRPEKVLQISVARNTNIALLERSVAGMIWGGGFVQGEGSLVANARHKELLDKAFGNMVSVDKGLREAAAPETVAIDMKEAIFNLGLIVGKSVSEDILDRIFEQFCIGK